MSDQNTKQITLKFFYDVPLEVQRIFANQIKWIIDEWLGDVPPLLMAILVVPEGHIPQTINDYYAQTDFPAASYTQGPHSPEGVAAYGETEGNPHVVIIFDDRLIRRVTPQGTINDIASTVLEEFYHAEIYSLQVKTLGPLSTLWNGPICRARLRRISALFHDEYAVNRKKSTLYQKTGLGSIAYGESISNRLNNGHQLLSALVENASKGQIPSDEAVTQSLEIINRYIFDPLARNAAYIAGNPQDNHPNNDAHLSEFYKKVKPFWLEIETQLQHSFDSGFEQYLPALDSIVETLKSFCSSIGIEFTDQPDHDYCVTFRTN